MTSRHPVDDQVASLRRLRRNAWTAIGLCLLFRLGTAMAPTGQAGTDNVRPRPFQPGLSR